MVTEVFARSLAFEDLGVDQPPAELVRGERPRLRVFRGRPNRVALVRDLSLGDFDPPDLGVSSWLRECGRAPSAREALTARDEWVSATAQFRLGAE